MSEPASKLTPEMERELGTPPINAAKRSHDELLQKPAAGEPVPPAESTGMGPVSAAAEAAEAKATGKLPTGESQLKRSRTAPEETPAAAMPQGRLVVGEEPATGGQRERVVESEVRPNVDLGQQQQSEEETKMKHEEDIARQKLVEDRVRQIKETERLDSNRGDVQLQKEQEAEGLRQPKNRPEESTGLEAMKGSAPHKPTEIADTPNVLPPH